MRWCLSLAIVLSACRGSSVPEPSPAGRAAPVIPQAPADAVAAADPWAPADAMPVTPAQRAARVAGALARVATIQPQLAVVRELAMPTPVPAEQQTTEQFRAFVQNSLAEELPAAKAVPLQRGLLHLGVFMKSFDLAKVLEQTMTSQAAAYYDPAAKKFFVVMVPESDMLLDTMSAHELTHALQDHHFDLTKYLPPTLDDDAASARRFVVEGDATFTMFAYLATKGGGADKLKPVLGMLRTQIEAAAAMGISDYATAMKQQAAAFPGMDDSMKTAMESMEDLPPVIIGPMIDSYMKGAVVAITAYEAGGWKAVDALYATPPDSTEQVLHPATKLIGTRERPRKVTLPALPGTEVTRNVMGELQWAIYLQQWGAPEAPEAAAGWGGDRYLVVEQGGHLVGYLATVWDAPADAQAFAAAYVATLAKRFPGADVSAPAAGVPRGDHGKVFVRVDGAKVFIVDGADDAKAIEALARGTRIQ